MMTGDTLYFHLNVSPTWLTSCKVEQRLEHIWVAKTAVNRELREAAGRNRWSIPTDPYRITVELSHVLCVCRTSPLGIFGKKTQPYISNRAVSISSRMFAGR